MTAGDAMKAKDLKERASKDLVELKATLEKDLFNHRMKNFTNQLDDTSSIPKKRRDLARIKGELHRRDLEQLAKETTA